jgi:hypothetical protein
MPLQEQLRPLLAQYKFATSKGNLTFANSTLMQVIELMSKAIDQPCPCCQTPTAPTVVAASPTKQPVGKRSVGRPKKAR